METLRNHEREGLIAEPIRTPSGYREYPHGVFRRVRFIRRVLVSAAATREFLTVTDEGLKETPAPATPRYRLPVGALARHHFFEAAAPHGRWSPHSVRSSTQSPPAPRKSRGCESQYRLGTTAPHQESRTENCLYPKDDADPPPSD